MTKQEIINNVDNAVYQGAVAVIHGDKNPVAAVHEIHHEYPFIKEDILWMGLQKKWKEVMTLRTA